MGPSVLPDETAKKAAKETCLLTPGVYALHPLHSCLRITCCKLLINKVISYVGMQGNTDFDSGIKGLIRLENKVGRWLIETEEQTVTGNYP